MDDPEARTSETPDLSGMTLHEIMATTDPEILAKMARVIEQTLRHRDDVEITYWGNCGGDSF